MNKRLGQLTVTKSCTAVGFMPWTGGLGIVARTAHCQDPAPALAGPTPIAVIDPDALEQAPLHELRGAA